MGACRSCGADNPEGQRFCGGCGAPLGAALPASAPEERKVVTALFCDLVGFTAASESADPEDIDRVLTAYFALARSAIEGHGGVVEKFIGDAVVGVFGVPAAHEDDPERAIRAALRICEDAERLPGIGGAPLRLRIGINTGEALVRLGVTPGSGERFLAGDAINTASRIQSVAPEMGVAAGLATYEATRATFEFVELEPATLKGKAQPVRVFHARAPRARLGVDLTRTHDGPFVGREIDTALLHALFAKTVSASSVQLVTVVGEPGIGKSRIVAELLAHAQATVPALTWRQGRCLPYGDGVTFWALGEIVKAQAGILESDDPETASAKIDDVVSAGPDRDWLRQRLRPLVGVDVTSSADREELFAAWRTFLEGLAEVAPTVLVFEDIHWADDAMLAFLEHLAAQAHSVPLLLVATARPELFERHASFAAGLPNVNRINLAPLSDADTGRLVAGLLGALVPPELAAPILERAEGNPLYAEEFVRLLRDRDLLLEAEGAVSLRAGADIPLPGSIGALIAARLDTLPADRKAMLADAAVVGKVFWAGAVAAMGGYEAAEVVAAMRELYQKELVRSARHSSMAGEAEFAFWHVVVRDVAYGQLPRASRAARHVAAATWLEAKAGDRAEDIAEVLSHHYATALDLANAAGQAERVAELQEPARRFLVLAGEKAMYLDGPSAVASLERALALAPPGHEARPAILARFGQAVYEDGRNHEAAAALEEATASFRARGDLRAAGRAMYTLFGVLQALADPRAWAIMPEAATLLEPLGPTSELVDVLSRMAANEILQGRDADALPIVDRALAMARELGMAVPPIALRVRGVARADLGDRAGIDDLREAVRLAIQAGGRGVPAVYGDLAAILYATVGPGSSIEVLHEAIAFARSRGLLAALDWLAVNELWARLDFGEVDEVLSVAAEIAPRLASEDDVSNYFSMQCVQAWGSALQGEGARVLDSLDSLERVAREAGHSGALITGLLASAKVRTDVGQDDAAAALLQEIAAYPGATGYVDYAGNLPSMLRIGVQVGGLALAERMASGVEGKHPYGRHAMVASEAILSEARGDLESASSLYADAAARWERFGVVPEHAFALLGQGRCLVELDRAADAVPVLQRARELFKAMGAAPALAETDALLTRSAGATA